MKNPEVFLSEATFEQIAEEIHARAKDFIIVAVTEDGSHGKHSQVWYSRTHSALGLAVFAENFLLQLLSQEPDK